MQRYFEQVEEELRSRLLDMGALAEEMIHLAIQVLLERKVELLQRINGNEDRVNRLHIEIDDRALKLIALYQPAAADLRFIMAAVKINSDLERIADQTVNIAENMVAVLKFPKLGKKFFDIPRMADLARGMLKDSLEAFVKKDVSLAREVIARDDEEDKLKTEAFEELRALMQSDPGTIPGALGMILISRNLERIADHATNIAEDAIFMALGKDIRHHAEETT